MALFGIPNAFLGLDIGTSNIKLVELVNRRRRIELVTYATATLPNLLLNPGSDKNNGAVRTANTIATMLDRAGVSTDAVITALPSSIVFSTVITLPAMPEKDMNQAVHLAARDVVPADVSEMVLGWSRVGEAPHMDTDKNIESSPRPDVPAQAGGTIPIFVTAAPKNIVERYIKVMTMLKLDLKALEVETFPLVRALFDNPATASGLIIDIGDLTTTVHMIDGGAPRASHTLDIGGAALTAAVGEKLGLAHQAAEQQKITQGLTGASPELRQALTGALDALLKQVKGLVDIYTAHSRRALTKTILIGGGANLKGLEKIASTTLGHPAIIGNPWRGLSFPQGLESRLAQLGPTFTVAAGLALRGARSVQ